MSESTGELQKVDHSEKTAVKIPIYRPEMESVSKEIVEGEKKGEVEFKREKMQEEMISLTAGYEEAIKDIAEEIHAEKRLKGGQNSKEIVKEERVKEKRSIKNLFGFRARKLMKGEGLTAHHKHPFEIMYERKGVGDNTSIAPESFSIDISPQGVENSIDSKLNVQFKNGRIKELVFAADTNFSKWADENGITDPSTYHTDGFANPNGDKYNLEKERRQHLIKVKMPITRKWIFHNISVALQLQDETGNELENPILKLNVNNGNKGKYEYNFEDDTFKFIPGSWEHKSGFHLREDGDRYNNLPREISANPVGVAKDMLNLIPANKV